jgi:hypothetical protein
MPTYNQPAEGDDAYLAEMRRLRARVEALERANPLRNAAISDGGQLIIRGTNGDAMVLLGRYDVPGYEAPDGHKQMTVAFWRDTGEIAFELVDAEPTIDGFQQYWSLFDRAGNRTVSDDATSGQGLARPYLPVVFYDYPAYPTQTTTSTTFETLQRASAAVKQHPRIQVGVLVRSDPGTTGQVRLWDATHGVQVGSTISIGEDDYQGYNIGPVALTGDHMEGVDLDVQARVTSGPGSIGVRVTTAYGVQS